MFSRQAKYLDFKKLMIEMSFVFFNLFNPLLHYGFCFVSQIILRFDSKMCKFWVCSAKDLSSYESVFLLGGNQMMNIFPGLI